METLPLQQGAPLRHTNYEQSKRALLDLAAERGYLDARLTRSELLVDLERYTATAVLHLESGARYRFGAVRFEQGFFDPDFLARFVPFKPGDPYSTSGLLQLQTGLSNTEYFKQVDVRPRRDLVQDLVVPVDVTLKLREPNKYTVGIGFGTDTGARAKFGWERRLINPTGDRFLAALDVSQVRSTADVRYLIPVFDPRTDHVALGASLHDDEATSFTSKRSVLGVGLSHTRRSWRELLSLNYQRERFTAGSDSGVATLLMPGAGWTYVHADNRLQPRHGGRLQLEVRGANEHVGSDLSFWQLHLGGKYIVPVGSGARIITRADAGHIATPNFRKLPASLRFYTGGSQSVRGYPYQGLAAVDEAGLTIGGSNLLVGSIELEQRVWQAWSAAVFYDTGKAFNDSSEPFNDGAGVGLRWRLPVGLLQLDVAQALTRESKPWRVHFLIGAEL
ncbi:MAG TPA: autotransporter assembly complex family protein, partial [Burkholderiaceae bacterium]|nr:autotransporter assembly complex family protein [Burkholderiaceae bacterium]